MRGKKDKRLLRELIKKGRLSFADLARRCHMSRQGVFSRIKSLKRQGIIKNFTVSLDEKKLGLNVRAYVLIETEPLRRYKNKELDILKKLPQISQIHHLYGRFGFIMEVVTKDMDELKDIVRKIHDLEAVRRSETMIVFRTYKYKPYSPVEGVLS